MTINWNLAYRQLQWGSASTVRTNWTFCLGSKRENRLQTEMNLRRNEKSFEREFFVSFDWPELDFNWETDSGELKFLRLAKNDKTRKQKEWERKSKTEKKDRKKRCVRERNTERVKQKERERIGMNNEKYVCAEERIEGKRT